MSSHYLDFYSASARLMRSLIISEGIAHSLVSLTPGLSDLRRMSLITSPTEPLTTLYHRAPLHPSSNPPLLVFIPGNPGLIDYYTTYLDLIAKQHRHYEILAISHAGYQTSDDYQKEGEVYGLEYQILHKCRVIRDHILSTRGQRKVEVSFLCHSMGSYIMQRVAKRLVYDSEYNQYVDIKFVGLVCPTIVDIAKSLLGQYFTSLFNWLPLVHVSVYLIVVLQWLLPDWAAESLIRNRIVAKPAQSDKDLMESWNNAVNATMKIYKSKRIVRQTIVMAKEELNQIHRDDEFNDWFFNELPTSGTKIWSFFAPFDYWVHDNSRDYVLTRYHDPQNENVCFVIGDADTEEKKAINHSFCIDQSVEFAEITCDALSKS